MKARKEDIVVYTALSGGHDRLRDNQEDEGVRFVCFSDVTHKTQVWETIPIELDFGDFNRSAKYYKMMPHVLFPDVKYSLWMDSSIHLKHPIDQIIEECMGENDLMLHKHYARKCIYEEAEYCIEKKLDDVDVIRAQMQQYREEGYPENNGLPEAGVLLRKHTPEMQKFNELWWQEVLSHSKRDQLSFGYLARKHGLKFGYFPGSFRDSDYPYFLWTPQIRQVMRCA